jgi:hypothetical protein
MINTLRLCKNNKYSRMVENSPFDLEGGSGSRLDELELEGLEAGLAKKPT